MAALPTKHKLAVINNKYAGHKHSAKYGCTVTHAQFPIIVEYQAVKQEKKAHHHG